MKRLYYYWILIWLIIYSIFFIPYLFLVLTSGIGHFFLDNVLVHFTFYASLISIIPIIIVSIIYIITQRLKQRSRDKEFRIKSKRRDEFVFK